MKKIMYEIGPDIIKVGPVINPVEMRRGDPREFDDETAGLLLKKPMFKEYIQTDGEQGGEEKKQSVKRSREKEE